MSWCGFLFLRLLLRFRETRVGRFAGGFAERFEVEFEFFLIRRPPQVGMELVQLEKLRLAPARLFDLFGGIGDPGDPRVAALHLVHDGVVKLFLKLRRLIDVARKERDNPVPPPDEVLPPVPRNGSLNRARFFFPHS